MDAPFPLGVLMELLILLVLGVIVVALGIALAPFILPLIGWLLGLALVVAAIGVAVWLAVQALTAMSGVFQVVGGVYRTIWVETPRAFWRDMKESLPPRERVVRVGLRSIGFLFLIPVLLASILIPLMLLNLLTGG